MMKKRVLMPLLVAGMMVASVVSLNSCNKQENAVVSDIVIPEDIETIPIVVEGSRGFKYCPYCGVNVQGGNLNHLHSFGVGWDYVNNVPIQGEFDVDYCCYPGSDINGCPYSGTVQDEHPGDPRYEARYHVHRIYYLDWGEWHDGWFFPNGGHNQPHAGGGTLFEP